MATRQTWKSPTKNPNFPQFDQNAKKHENRQNDVIFTVWATQKKELLKNIKFRFLGRMSEILAVHRSKTNNRQNTAMNFRNPQILKVHCPEGR